MVRAGENRAHNKEGVMEIGVEMMQLAMGRIPEMILHLLGALRSSLADIRAMKSLWASQDFWDESMGLLVRTHELVARTPEAIVEDVLCPIGVRIRALAGLNDDELLGICLSGTSLYPAELVDASILAFRDEFKAVNYILRGRLQFLKRIPTMVDLEQLLRLATLSHGDGIGCIAVSRIEQLAPERLKDVIAHSQTNQRVRLMAESRLREHQ
jgi:hypothetical protein